MKNLTFILVTFLLSNFVFSQNFSELAEYDFPDKESYASMESEILKATNYLYNNPYDKKKLNQLHALQFIIKWMSGTPDYTFEIGNEFNKLTKGSDGLFGLGLAGMTKTVLENKDKKLSNQEIYNYTENLLVEYCSKKENNLKPSKQIKKILKAKE